MTIEDPAVGWVSPPGWLDPGPAALLEMAGSRLQLVQSVIDLDRFPDHPSRMIDLAEPLTRAALAVSRAPVQLVAQSGTQFALGYADDPAGLARVRDDIETACGKPVLIGALTLIEALRALDVGSAVIVGCYYDEAFLAATSTLFEAHGIRVAQASNWVREGRFESQQAVDALHWHYEERWGLDSLETLAAGRLPADCAFVVPGAGIRTVVAADALKAAAGRPVVGGDAAFLWAILRQLNLARSDLARVPGGRLFRML